MQSTGVSLPGLSSLICVSLFLWQVTRDTVAMPYNWSVVLVAFAAFAYFFLYQRKNSASEVSSPYLSKVEVAAATGDAERILVCIIGHCYDVSNGRSFYGANGGYSFFAGTDAARAYATGDFKNDLNDNTADFTPHQCQAVVHWYNFYKNSEKYTFAGYLECIADKRSFVLCTI